MSYIDKFRLFKENKSKEKSSNARITVRTSIGEIYIGSVKGGPYPRSSRDKMEKNDKI